MTLKRIGSVKITLEPWVYDNPHDILKIRVDVNGREYHSEVILGPDDINSRLDHIFAAAKQHLVKAVNGDFWPVIIEVEVEE
jgi:hypothetical protein